MSQDSLMQRMIAAGVNILNSQEVFDFYHSQGGEINLEDLKLIVDQWIAAAIFGKADSIDLDAKADKTELANKADKTDLDFKADKTALNDKADKSDLTAKVNRDELLAYAEKTALAPKVNREELSLYATKDELLTKASQDDLSILDAEKADKAAVNQQLSEKLDRSEFQQHFRGLFATAEALKEQVLNPIAGDYASVDAGIGSPTETHAYDVDDGIWRLQGSSGLSVTSTDSVPEGNANLYFSAARAESVFRGMNSGLLPEGLNLYFTTARAQAVFRGMNTGDLTEGTNLYHTAERVKLVVKGMNSGDLPEGTNKYFTDARVTAVVNPLLQPILNQIGEIDALAAQILGT